MNILNPDNNIQTDDRDVDYFEELAGPGKKFDKSKFASDEEWTKAVLKAKYEADKYIDTTVRQKDELRSDYERLRDDYNTKAKLEELLDQLKADPKRDDNTRVDDTTKPATPSLEDFDKLMNERLNQHEQNKKYDANAKSVQDKLRDRYGENYHSTVKQQIESLGLDDAIFNEMARKHPTALIRTLGLDQPVQRDTLTAPRSTQGAPMRGNKKPTWSFYQEMKKSNPDLYWKPETQVQLHKDRTALGEAFEDGDWHA